jgi:hypothetical protein
VPPVLGGAQSHGRCLPDVEEELFPPHLTSDDTAAAADDVIRRREELADAYDEIPVSVEDPLSVGGCTR